MDFLTAEYSTDELAWDGQLRLFATSGSTLKWPPGPEGFIEPDVIVLTNPATGGQCTFNLTRRYRYPDNNDIFRYEYTSDGKHHFDGVVRIYVRNA
jgi:hypothetical protein